MDHRQFFHDVHDAYPEPPKWVIQDLLPVGMTVIGAPPKNFKSTLADALPCIVAGWPCNVLPAWASIVPEMTGPAVILSGDATTAELNWLFNKGFGLKTTPETIFVNDDPWDFKLDNKKRMHTLFAQLEQLRPRVLLIDPFRKYISGDENDSQYLEEILYPLRKWAISNDSSLILVHHLQKDPIGASIDDLLDPARLRGSGVLFANADCVLMCRCINRFTGLERVNAIFKRGAPWDRTFYLGVPGYGENWKIFGEEEMKEQDLNIKRLATQGAIASQIAKQLHIKQTEVDESIAKILRNEGKVKIK